MNVTEEQRQSLLEASKPLIKWLNDNCHPHCQATVDCDTVVLTEGLATAKTTEFIKD